MTHFILDCDDVLLDWQSGFVGFLAGRSVSVDPAGPASWNLGEWIGCSDEAACSWVARFNASNAFARLDAMPGAYDFITELRIAGHTASVVTCCGRDRPVAQARVRNLARAFGSAAFNAISILNIGESKVPYLLRASQTVTGPLVFIEDNPEHAARGAELQIPSYCLRRSHNRASEDGSRDIVWIDHLRQAFH